MRRHPLLFEISAWPWLERLSRHEGREVDLGTVPAAYWDGIAEKGFDLVFLMGVWRRSAIGRDIARTASWLIAEYDRILPGWTAADVPGSPYCIQSYEPDERMGGWRGLDAARRELKNRGISLVLDFVPNHTGFDHPWITEHPERYVLGTDEDHRAAPADFRAAGLGRRPVHIACGRDPYFAAWTDVAQLNYFNPDTRAAVRATLGDIAAHCDGVRCDMAMLVLNDVFDHTWRRLLRDAWPAPATEFWPEATRAVPDLLYLAEVYWGLQGRLLDQGFTFAYDKRLFDALHSTDRASGVRELLTASGSDSGRLARFLENHDEPRSAATLAGQLPAAASLLASLPGMRFFFDGQLEGWHVKAPVQLGRWPDERLDEGVRALYDRVIDFARNELLHEGEWKPLTVAPAGDQSFSDVVAYRWRTASALAVIAANVGDVTSHAHLAISNDLGPGESFDFDDRLTGASYRWTRAALLDRGLYVRLDSGQAHLFTVHVHAD